MSKKIAISAYTYEELDEKAKHRVEQWYSEHCMYHDWYAEVYEDWLGHLDKLGISTDEKRMMFSGFCSQGDGASFTGAIDVPKFMLAHELVGDYLEDYAEAVSPDSEVSATLEQHSGNYCHDGMVYLNHGGMSEKLGSAIEEVCRVLMRDFYRDLEKEWEYQISSEAIADACAANDWLFHKDGRRINVEQDAG